jgi:hypothetical protein
MPLRVISLSRYFANRSLQWRPEDYDAYKWVQALKGNELNGYARVPVQGALSEAVQHTAAILKLGSYCLRKFTSARA